MLKEEYLSPTVDALRAGTSSDTDIPHNLMTTLRERRLDLRAELDFDEDDMTEITSRTDDDVVRDAFRFLDTSDNEERDDEIVWNPRFVLCRPRVLSLTGTAQGICISCYAPRFIVTSFARESCNPCEAPAEPKGEIPALTHPPLVPFFLAGRSTHGTNDSSGPVERCDGFGSVC